MPFKSARFQSPAELEEVLQGRKRYDRGSRGEGVKKVQQALIDLGYGCGWLGADGVFGRDTYSAVWRFKTDRTILHAGGGIDGIVGPKTMEALDKEFGGGGGGGGGGSDNPPVVVKHARWDFLVELWEEEGSGAHKLGKLVLTPSGVPQQAESSILKVESRTGDLGSLLAGWASGEFTLKTPMPGRNGGVSAAWQQGFSCSGFKRVGLAEGVEFNLDLRTLSGESVNIHAAMSDRTKEQMFRSGTYQMRGTLMRA